MLKVFHNDVDWVIAESVEDAIKVWEQFAGEKWSEFLEANCGPPGDNTYQGWYEDDREKWTIVWHENLDMPIEDGFIPQGAMITVSGTKVKVTASQEAWVKLLGRGWFCSYY